MFRSTAITLALCLTAVTAQATLVGRSALTPGGTDYQAYYDDVLSITWLQDANYARTSGFDSDDLMTWSDAQTWTASLNSAGHLGSSGWRLPTMDVNGDATVVKCSIVTEFECRDNELGYLTVQYGITPTTNGPFTNVNHNYWSGTDYDAVTDGWPNGWPCNSGPSGYCAWRQGFSADSQNYVRKVYDGYSVWAVMDGDVAAVPIPPAIWLFGSALGLTGAIRRKVTA